MAQKCLLLITVGKVGPGEGNTVDPTSKLGTRETNVQAVFRVCNRWWEERRDPIAAVGISLVSHLFLPPASLLESQMDDSAVGHVVIGQ